MNKELIRSVLEYALQLHNQVMVNADLPTGSRKIEKALASLDEGEPVEYCEWKQDDDGNFSTSCEQTWCIDGYDPPKENGYNFCPHCGKPIRIKE